MSGWRRWIGGLAGPPLAALVLLPVAALAGHALLEPEPGGPRPTAFYLALAAWDPLTRACLLNSLLIAGTVSAAAWGIGSALARANGRGASTIRGLVGATAVVPPVFGAIGLISLFGRWGVGGPSLASWGALLLLELCWGAAVVAESARRALARLDPTAEDAARLAGAGEARAWRTLIRPVVRPDVTRAVAAVFTLTLAEPGAPLILGLRRTLAYQLVETVRTPATYPQAAALGLLTLATALSGRMLILWWGGPSRLTARPSRPRRGATEFGRSRAWVCLVIGGVWSALALLPLSGLITTSLSSAGESTQAPSLVNWRSLPGDAAAWALLARSLGVGLVAALLGLALAGLASRAGAVTRRLAAWAGGVPPLVFGVGMLLLATGGVASRAGSPLAWFAAALDPYRSPWPPLVLVLVALHLPDLLRAAAACEQDWRPEWVEAARTLGAGRPRAWVLVGLSLRLRGLVSPFVEVVWRSALGAGAAFVLAPTAQGPTLGPALWARLEEPGQMGRVATLALVSLALMGVIRQLANRWAVR